MSSDEGPRLRSEERTFYVLDVPAGQYIFVAQVFAPGQTTPEPLAAFNGALRCDCCLICSRRSQAIDERCKIHQSHRCRHGR